MKYHYTNLRVYQTANELVHMVFDATSEFPKSQIFVTTSQLQRASQSVVLNIVEGNAKRLTSTKEMIRFFKIAYGSLIEAEYLLVFSKERGWIQKDDYEKLDNTCHKCGAELWKLIANN